MVRSVSERWDGKELELKTTATYNLIGDPCCHIRSDKDVPGLFYNFIPLLERLNINYVLRKTSRDEVAAMQTIQIF